MSSNQVYTARPTATTHRFAMTQTRVSWLLHHSRRAASTWHHLHQAFVLCAPMSVPYQSRANCLTDLHLVALFWDSCSSFYDVLSACDTGD